MEKRDERFLEAMKAALNNETVHWEEEIAPAEWYALFEQAEQHHVLPMIYEAVYLSPSARRMDPSVLYPFKNGTVQQVLSQSIRSGQFLHLLQHLEKAGIRPLVVKGIVCRNLFPKPDHRISGDEDILILPDRFKSCHEALLGYGMCLAEPEQEQEIDSAYEVPYGKPGSPLYIEVHKSLFPPESEAYGDLNRFFEQVFDRAESIVIDGVSVYTLCSTDHLFYLICHAFKHFLHSGFGIRQVCDIVMFANTYGEKIDWERVLKQCRDIHADVFAAALFRIGRLYFGFSEEKACYPEEWRRIETDESALLEDLLCSGVYGASDMSRKHSSNITLNAVSAQKKGERTRHNVLKAVFPPLSGMKKRYPYLKKYLFLLPVAWADRIVKYRRETRMLKDNHAADSIRIGNQRIELLKQYQVIQKEEKRSK